MRDPRIDELVYVVEQLLGLHARIMSEAAARRRRGPGRYAAARHSSGWRRGGTNSPRSRWAMCAASTAARRPRPPSTWPTALARWRERGEATADLAFWRDHLDSFRSPKAFALVVDALLHKERSPRRHGAAGQLARPGRAGAAGGRRALLSPAGPALDAEPRHRPASRNQPESLAAGAGRQVLRLPRSQRRGVLAACRAWTCWSSGANREEEAESEEELFGAAYEGVTYHDSTDDDEEGDVLETGPREDFDLEEEGERIEKRLHFLSTVARLWQVATRLEALGKAPAGAPEPERFRAWLGQARKNHQELLALLDVVHEHPIPEPLGSYESVVEYDRRRSLKERLLHVIIATCLDTALAVGALQGTLSADGDAARRQPVRASGRRGSRW